VNKKLTTAEYAARLASMPVDSVDNLRARQIEVNDARLHFQQDIKKNEVFTVKAGKKLSIDLNNKECALSFVVLGELEIFDGTLSHPLSGTGTIVAKNIIFTGSSVATGNISNSSFTDCLFPSTFSTGVVTHSVISGRMASVEYELILGSAVNTPVAIKVDLAGGLNCYDPDDSNINLTGDYTQTANQGTQTNILARNISLSSAVSYTNPAATPTTIGGWVAGSTFSAVDNDTMWTTLLYPYQSPTFSTFSISGQSITLEVGDSVTSGSKTFTWSTTNSANINTNSLTITNHTDAITLGSSLANDGTESLSLASAITKTSQASHTFRISGINSNSITFTRDFIVSWRFRVYHGENTTATLNETQIEALGTSTLTSSAAGTYSFLAGGRKHICYPNSFTQLTTFKDALTLLNVDMNPVYVVSITNSFGVTQDYYCHSTLNVLGSAIDIICA
jgi:hypothetical protein